jgi:hypothetical protein
VDKSKQDAGVNLVPTLALVGLTIKLDDIRSITSEYQMTVRSKYSELSLRQISMLLSVSNYRAVHEGVDFSLYMVMEHLYSILWKNGHDPIEVANERVRKTLVLSDVILSYIRGNWLNLSDRERLPDTIREEIISLSWLPTERTMASWSDVWNLERFFEIKTVPLDIHWHRSKYQTAERYSGYTKGYGNDGSPASPGKTKPTRELDGDDTEKPPPQLSLQEFEDYQNAIRLIEYAKAHRKQQR